MVHDVQVQILRAICSKITGLHVRITRWCIEENNYSEASLGGS